MKFANKHLFSGLLIGTVVVIGGLAVHAHEGPSHGEGMHGSNLHSMTGTPDELSQRTHELSEHICATIKAATDCPVTPISDKAATELSAMQAPYAEGQGRLHEAMTAANFDRATFDQVQTEQANAIRASEVRYMQFLGDAAASLTPDQRQMFSRKGHAGH